MIMQKQLELPERELVIRNYSRKTIKSYLYGLKEYFSFKKQDFDIFNAENIKDFLRSSDERGVSAQTRNLFLNAIKFFYRNVVKINGKIEIQSAKKNKSLPIVLSKPEIEIIIEVTKNIKHRLLLSLAYGAGLRVSEVIELKVKDINFSELVIHIKLAKGNK